MSNNAAGILFVISAPSGTGKSTVAARLLQTVSDLEFSVSYTTREPREGEQDGREYHFIDSARFEAMIDDGAFLEWARVFERNYGTGLEATRRKLEQGQDLLLDIDVQGARQVQEGPIPAVSLMLLPPDYATLERRLRQRGSESEELRKRRLAQARREAQDYPCFDYLVINDGLEESVAGLAAVIAAERRRTERCVEQAGKIIDTFPV